MDQAAPLKTQQPLKSSEVSEILRYWLLALRYEESLASRPQAHKVPSHRDKTIHPDDPQDGQEYFKLLLAEGANLMLQSSEQIALELNPERAAFCEHCIRAAWKREFARNRWEKASSEQDSGLWVLGFPVIYLPRHEELAPVLRFPISLQWKEGERLWPMPSYPNRRQSSKFKPAKSEVNSTPSTILLSKIEDNEGLLPYSLDPQLLTRELGVCDEEWADFHQALRQQKSLSPVAMIRAVCELLETGEAHFETEDETPPSADETEHSLALQWITRLQAAIQHRLDVGANGLKAYPIGLVYDDSRVQATVHVQTELSALIQTPPGEAGWLKGAPLWHYLSATPIQTEFAPFHGRITNTPLNPEQLQAGEAFFGTRFHALQGPPGTGKTALILNLAAAQLCERVYGYCNNSTMSSECLLVASTNNRAVDNVLDPLGRAFTAGELPLGLRLGNREVTSKLTVQILETCLRRIVQSESEPEEIFEGAFEEKKSLFLSLYKSLQLLDEPRQQAFKRQTRRIELQNKINALESKLSALENKKRTPIQRAQGEEALENIRKFSRQIDKLADKAAGSGRKTLEAVENQWKRIKKSLVVLQNALEPLEIELDFPLPPKTDSADPETLLEAWEDACGDADEQLSELSAQLNQQLDAHQKEAQLASYQEELRSIEKHAEADEEWLNQPLRSDTHAEQEFQLFQLAVQLRDLWAFLHRAPLKAALETAIEFLSTRSSFRRFFEEEPEKTLQILKLFPILGCTLLSLGNALPAREGILSRLVIDEAGQCHPAYAISGLMRAHRALLIGDVHQLEPVIKLALTDEARVQRQAKISLTEERLTPYRVYEQCGHSAQSLADLPIDVDHRPSLLAHYRCQPGIISISESLCGYGLRVLTPPHRSPACADFLTDSLLFVPVYGTQCRRGGSWENPAEISFIIELLHQFERRNLSWNDLAFITPYVGQCDAIQRTLRQRHIPFGEDFLEPDPTLFAFSQTGAVATGTVHRFQGGERSIVVFSTVCTEHRSLAFLNERANLLNVAVSRAKDHFIVLGDPRVLEAGRFTRSLLTGRPLHLEPKC